MRRPDRKLPTDPRAFKWHGTGADPRPGRGEVPAGRLVERDDVVRRLQDVAGRECLRAEANVGAGGNVSLLHVYSDRDPGNWYLYDRAQSKAQLLFSARAGIDLAWENGAWRASAGAVRHAPQDRVAALETPTRGYTLVDAHLAYHWDSAHAGWELFLDGTNLTDTEARVHTSFLKEVAPLPGRAVVVGVRAFF